MQKNRYVMYHGTDIFSGYAILNEGFKASKDGPLGAGVYLSQSLNKASVYGPCVLMCEVELLTDGVLNIGNMSHSQTKTWAEEGF